MSHNSVLSREVDIKTVNYSQIPPEALTSYCYSTAGGVPVQVEFTDQIDNLSALSDEDYLEQVEDRIQQEQQERHHELALQLERRTAEIKRQNPAIEVVVYLTESDSESETDWNIVYAQQVAQIVNRQNELEQLSLNWESSSENISHYTESTTSFEWIDL